jgi:hypothetical protein
MRAISAEPPLTLAKAAGRGVQRVRLVCADIVEKLEN